MVATGVYLNPNYHSEYYQLNKIKMDENSMTFYRSKSPIICDCGSSLRSKQSYNRHLDSKLHKKKLKFIKNIDS